MKCTSQHCYDKTLDKNTVLYRDQWDISNMMKDLFEIGFDMLFSDSHKIMANKLTFVTFRG